MQGGVCSPSPLLEGEERVGVQLVMRAFHPRTLRSELKRQLQLMVITQDLNLASPDLGLYRESWSSRVQAPGLGHTHLLLQICSGGSVLDAVKLRGASKNQKKFPVHVSALVSVCYGAALS